MPAAFGGGGFGGGAAATGTGQVPYSKTTDQDGSTPGAGGAKQTVHLNSISAMKPYEGKSPEELRWEDYSVRHHSSVILNLNFWRSSFASLMPVLCIAFHCNFIRLCQAPDVCASCHVAADSLHGSSQFPSGSL